MCHSDFRIHPFNPQIFFFILSVRWGCLTPYFLSSWKMLEPQKPSVPALQSLLAGLTWSFCLAFLTAHPSTPISSPFYSVMRARTNVYLDKSMRQLGMAAYHVFLVFRSWNKEGHEFKASQRYILRPCLKIQKRTKARTDAQLVQHWPGMCETLGSILLV